MAQSLYKLELNLYLNQTMAGHKPIFAGLISGIFLFFRDSLFKVVLEPKAPNVRRAERIEKIQKDKKKGLD